MKNQIQVGRENVMSTNNSNLNIDFLEGFKTDSAEKSRLCSGICIGNIKVNVVKISEFSFKFRYFIQGTTVVCTLLESTCLVLVLEEDSATGIPK